jgi:hypothetical protein
VVALYETGSRVVCAITTHVQTSDA